MLSKNKTHNGKLKPNKTNQQTHPLPCPANLPSENLCR